MIFVTGLLLFILTTAITWLLAQIKGKDFIKRQNEMLTVSTLFMLNASGVILMFYSLCKFLAEHLP